MTQAAYPANSVYGYSNIKLDVIILHNNMRLPFLLWKGDVGKTGSSRQLPHPRTQIYDQFSTVRNTVPIISKKLHVVIVSEIAPMSEIVPIYPTPSSPFHLQLERLDPLAQPLFSLSSFALFAKIFLSKSARILCRTLTTVFASLSALSTSR